jgi:hypothetical protein
MPRPKGSGNRSELVQLALVGIDSQIQQLQAQIAELNEKRKQLAKGGVTAAAEKVTGVAAATGGKKRVVSAATKKKLKEAAKARWAKARAEKEGKK